MFDLANDPHELTNAFDQPESREIVRQLTLALQVYCRTFDDPRGSDAKIRSDMAAALGEQGED